MREDGKISAGQLFTLAFLSRIIIMITVDSRLSGGQDLLDLTFSALWYLGLNLVLILPVWLLHRRYPKLDILEVSCYSLGKWGKGAAVL